MAGRQARFIGYLGISWLCTAAASGCRCDETPPDSDATVERAMPAQPTLRLVVASGVAGALEPCGCQKDMLGGVDHAAALLKAERAKAPASLFVGAGPMLFMDPVLDASRKTQDAWKAEALATSFKDMGLTAWAPGANDWAAGEAELKRLAGSAGATLLAGNLSGSAAGAQSTKIVTAGSLQVALAGVAEPKHRGLTPTGLKAQPLARSLEKARDELVESKADVLVGLVAAPRGQALRLAETVKGFHVLVVGKPGDAGEGNDAPTPPVLVNDTLVVQAPNHLQAVSIVDLYVAKDAARPIVFADGEGIEQAEKRLSLESRISELKRRIAGWEESKKINPKDLVARRRDLANLERQLRELKQPSVPSGSFFRYQLRRVRESAGQDAAVNKRMSSFYKRVNEHNKVAFKDREPKPLEGDGAGYVGIERCSSCHEEERKFWDTTQHAKAYETLSTQFKEFNLDCVSCHVTGYEKPGGSTVTHVEKLKNVQCEVCHGPGSKHAQSPKKAGLILASPPQSLCAPACHHPPHVDKSWQVTAAWSKIIGPGHGR